MTGFALVCFAGAVQSIGAATFTVTNTSDTGAGSLRAAIASANLANDADTIVFASPLFDTAQVINLTSGELPISQSVTITGRGARLLTVRRSSGTSRIFSVGATNITISGMTISNGNTNDFGGGINNDSGTTTILNSTISANTAPTGFGGGILVNGGTVNIANSTVSGNSAAANGGGGGITNFGMLNLNNVTVTGNITTNGNAGDVGGISNIGTTNTRNTIISGNTASGSTSPDVNGVFTSQGSNLIGTTTVATGFTQPTDKTNVAANLGGLANNGGQTDTHLPLAGSPAINAGNNCVVTGICGLNNPPAPLAFDQRGSPFIRDAGSVVDIGAVESAVLQPTASEVVVSGRALTSDGRGIRNVLIRLTDGSGAARTTTTGANGFYRFDKVAAGETYIFTVAGKRFQFTQPTQVVNVGEDLEDVNFISNE